MKGFRGFWASRTPVQKAAALAASVLMLSAVAAGVWSAAVLLIS